MTRHPDVGDEEGMSEVTRQRQQDLGHPKLDEELDRDELGEDSPRGQNSDWLPQ